MAVLVGSVGGDQEPLVSNAMLRTVVSQSNPVSDPTYQMSGVFTAGSLDVELEIDEEGQRALQSRAPGATVDVRARVMGGHHLTPGTRESVTAQRQYPELEYNGTGHGQAQIIKSADVGTHPILTLGEMIVLRVG